MCGWREAKEVAGAEKDREARGCELSQPSTRMVISRRAQAGLRCPSSRMDVIPGSVCVSAMKLGEGRTVLGEVAT